MSRRKRDRPTHIPDYYLLRHCVTQEWLAELPYSFRRIVTTHERRDAVRVPALTFPAWEKQLRKELPQPCPWVWEHVWTPRPQAVVDEWERPWGGVVPALTDRVWRTLR